MWGKAHGYPWWPAQVHYRSGIEMIRKIDDDQSLSGAVGTAVSAAAAVQRSAGPSKQVLGQGLGLSKPPIQHTQQQLNSSQIAQTTANSTPYSDVLHIAAAASPSVYVLFFLDETHYRVTPEEARTSVVPFLKRVKEVRSGMGKRLSTAYALATLEIESQRSAQCAYEYMSTDDLEITGGLGAKSLTD